MKLTKYGKFTLMYMGCYVGFVAVLVQYSCKIGGDIFAGFLVGGYFLCEALINGTFFVTGSKIRYEKDHNYKVKDGAFELKANSSDMTK